jgi:hypothetical protein
MLIVSPIRNLPSTTSASVVPLNYTNAYGIIAKKERAFSWKQYQPGRFPMCRIFSSISDDQVCFIRIFTQFAEQQASFTGSA